MKTERQATGTLSAVTGLAAVVAAFVLVFLDLGGREPSAAGWAAVLVVYFASNAKKLNRSAWVILAAATALFALAWLVTGSPAADAFPSAGFLFVFMLVMHIMAGLADRTKSIADAAELIVSRPPGQRYLFVTAGTHVFALFLNVGSVILLMTLLASRLRDAEEDTRRSLVLAGLRGFAATALWSPLALSILILFTQVSGVRYTDFIPAGIASALAFMAIGYVMERGRRSRAAAVNRMTRADWARLVPVGALALVLVTGGLAWVAVFDVRLIEGMFTVVFLLGALWTISAIFTGGMTSGQAAKDFARAGTGFANEIAIIAGATVMAGGGTSLIQALPGADGTLPPWAAAIAAMAAPLLMFGGGLLALNPVLTVALLASALNPLWPDPAKAWLIVSLTWGWAVTTCGTPYTANVLLTGQIIQRPSTQIALQWNGRFDLAVLMVACLGGAAGTFLAAS